MPLPVAALFTAFVAPVGMALFAMLIPIPAACLVFPPTFASAVARGEGDGWRSLSFPAPSFSAVREALKGRGCGAGEADFRVTTGRGKSGLGETEGVVDDGGVLVVILEAEDVAVGVDDVGVVLEDEAVDAEDEAAEGGGLREAGSVNSTGLTRGVACTLVINLARLQ